MTYTVRDFLNADLAQSHRTRDLEAHAARFTSQPLDTTVTSLRAVLTGPIGIEDYRRLHVLISHLYQSCGASIPLTTRLRTEVNTALTRAGKEVAR